MAARRSHKPVFLIVGSIPTSAIRQFGRFTKQKELKMGLLNLVPCAAGAGLIYVFIKGLRDIGVNAHNVQAAQASSQIGTVVANSWVINAEV